MAKEVNYNSEIRGDSFSRIMNFTQDGVATDITGWIIFFTIKEKEDDIDANAKIKKDITTHTDPANGKSLLLLTAEEMSGLLGEYYYDIQIKRPGGLVKTLTKGTITFGKDITIRTTPE